jgi:hypothetical protein
VISKSLTYFIILSSIFVFGNNSAAQVQPGARQNGLANSFAAVADDHWSPFYNPAGIAQINSRGFGVSYSPLPFGMKEFATGAISYNESFSFGNFGVTAQTYGFELYRENSFSITYANNFSQNFYAGIRVKYNTLSIQNYGSDSNFGIDLGFITHLGEVLKIGFAAVNLNRPTWGETKDKLPQIFRGGFSYFPIQNILLAFEIEKDVRYPFNLKFGLEYNFLEMFVLRFGYNNSPSKFAGGFGVSYSIFQINYAVSSHLDLGLTHLFGIDLKF